MLLTLYLILFILSFSTSLSLLLYFLFFLFIILPPPKSTLFPYTTLFRSIFHGLCRQALGEIAPDACNLLSSMASATPPFAALLKCLLLTTHMDVFARFTVSWSK